MCCSVLQCVAGCCCVLLRVAACQRDEVCMWQQRNALIPKPPDFCHELTYRVAMCCSVLLQVALWCSVLQCVAACCSVSKG